MPGKRHVLAAVMVLLAACAPAGPKRVVEARTTSVPAPRGEALLRQTMLRAHAATRAAVGVAPLVWNARLAADAQLYADVLARSGRFEHAHQPQGPDREGENLWVGTRDAYAYAEMIGAWADERRDYVDGVTPLFSRTGQAGDVAHYTQMVWRATAAVGCATASNARDDYLVCRYSPVGNVVGERAF